MLTDITDVTPLTGCHWEELSNHNQDEVLFDSYIPITKREFLDFARNDTSFFVSSDNETIVTCIAQGNSFVIVPLEPKYVKEVLQLHS